MTVAIAIAIAIVHKLIRCGGGEASFDSLTWLLQDNISNLGITSRQRSTNENQRDQ
jgi:hypothetical protein